MGASVFSTVVPVLYQYWWFFVLCIVIAICRTPVIKGMIGEFIVNIIARFSLDSGTYHLLKNITIPSDDGTTQIDHIIVSVYGIFVVETKHYKGWIYGTEKQKDWTKVIFKKKYKFQNPLRQNYKHTKTLEDFLNVPSCKIFSVIVFLGDCRLKSKMPENVTYGREYIDYIKSKREETFTDLEVLDIIDKIKTGRCTPSFKTNREHVKHVKKIKQGIKPAPTVNSNIALPVIQTQEEDFFQPITIPSDICKICNSEMVILPSKFKNTDFYWHCNKCNNNIAIKVDCPKCKSRMRVIKEKNLYNLKCDNCQTEDLYYSF